MRMPELDLLDPSALAAAITSPLLGWASARGASSSEMEDVSGSCGDIASAIAADLASRLRPEFVRGGRFTDLTAPVLAMEICDLLLVDAYGEYRYYAMLPADNRVRRMADQIAADTIAAWPAGA
jgi:hypothetical protein